MPAPSTPSTSRVLVVLLAPALTCLVLGVLAGAKGDIAVALIVVGIAVAGSVTAGIWSGIRLARRFNPSPAAFPWVAAGLSVACVIASGCLCFGGCLLGIMG